jgi:hypothetical protein
VNAVCRPAAAAVAGRQATTRSRPVRRPFAKGGERRPATANSATSSCLDRSGSSTDGSSFSDALDVVVAAIRAQSPLMVKGARRKTRAAPGARVPIRWHEGE